MRRIFNIALFTVLALMGVGCSQDESVKVGVVLPLSGDYQAYGEASKKGIELAFSEVADLARIELVFADSAGDAAQAAAELTTLFDGGAVIAIGGLTPAEVGAMIPVAEDRERVLLSPSAVAERQEIGKHFYTLATDGYTAGSSMATFAATRLNTKKAVVIAAADALPGQEDGFRSALTSQGQEVAASITATADASSTVSEALGHQPDAVYVAGYEGSASPLIRELRQQGFKKHILTNQTLASPGAFDRLGDAAKGVLLAHTIFEVDGNAEVTSFFSAYQQQYGEEPSIFAADGYDAFKVVATAVGTRPPYASEIRKGLIHDVKDFAGVTGSLQFNEQGEVSRMPRIYSVAEDLSLRDHGKHLDERKAVIEKKKQELKDRLERIRNEANGGGSDSPAS